MTQSQWEEGSSHFSRDILDIRLFSKDSGFSRMVEWAGARRIGIRWWKPYKDVAKASTRRRFHLGNLREHSIVAVITRIRGTDNFTYASSWPRSSIASNRNETASFSEFMRRRGGVDRYLSPSLSFWSYFISFSLSLIPSSIFPLSYFISFPLSLIPSSIFPLAIRVDSFDEEQHIRRICIALANVESVADARSRSSRFEIAFAKGKVAWWWGDCRLGKRVDSFTAIFVTSMIHIGRYR